MLVWNSSSSESDKLGIKLTCLLLVFREVGNLHVPQHHCDIIIDLLAQAEPFFFGFLGYVRGDAPDTAVGRALFAKYILQTDSSSA